MVAANKGFDRKAFQVAFPAWAAAWRRSGRSDACLYVHTDPLPQADGLDLQALAAACGIKDRVIFPDRYSYYLVYPTVYLAMVYNAADVHLAASMTEGFGIPIIEAQACGTPVVVTDFASMPELVRRGHAVETAGRFWVDGLRSWWSWPSAEAVEERLYESMTCDGWRLSLGERLRLSERIHEEFSWDVVVDQHWRPALEEVA
jgi:glycosyltransferase involved in cell wall biosynthesis